MIEPEEPMNTKRKDWEATQSIDLTMNYLYEDSIKQCGGYEENEEREVASNECYNSDTDETFI